MALFNFDSHSQFRSATITCPQCRWSGQGRHLTVGEVLERSMATEYHCPTCDEYLAVAAWPLIGEIANAVQRFIDRMPPPQTERQWIASQIQGKRPGITPSLV